MRRELVTLPRSPVNQAYYTIGSPPVNGLLQCAQMTPVSRQSQHCHCSTDLERYKASTNVMPHLGAQSESPVRRTRALPWCFRPHRMTVPSFRRTLRIGIRPSRRMRVICLAPLHGGRISLHDQCYWCTGTLPPL